MSEAKKKPLHPEAPRPDAAREAGKDCFRTNGWLDADWRRSSSQTNNGRI